MSSVRTDNGRETFTGTAHVEVRESRMENGGHRSLAELIKELRDETVHLLQQEVNLAKTEMTEKAVKLGKNAGFVGAGAALMYTGAVVLLLSIGWMISWALVEGDVVSQELGWWLGPGIVGLAVTLIGLGLTLKGANTLKNTSPMPERTVQSLKEDKEWVRNKVR